VSSKLATSISEWWRDNKLFCILAAILLITTAVFWWAYETKGSDILRKVETIVTRLSSGDYKSNDSMYRRVLFEELESFERGSFEREAFKHLALACLVAFILLVFVEIHTSNKMRREGEEYRQRLKYEVDRYKEEISENVWQAIAKSELPEDVVQELNRTLKSDVVFLNLYYTIRIGKFDYLNIPDDRIVVRRGLSFEVKNLTGQEGFPFPLYTAIISPYEDMNIQDSTGSTINLPRVVKYIIDDAGKEELLEVPKTGREFSKIVPLPKNRTIVVYSLSEELRRLEDRTICGWLQPAVNLAVNVRHEVDDSLDISVSFYHPNRKSLKQRREGAFMYEYKGGLLPGQNFSVEWKIKK
jgi:hypothetical protein